MFFWAIFGRELGSPGKDFYVFGDVFRFFPGLASSWCSLFQVSGPPFFPGIFRAFFAPAVVNLLQRDGGHIDRHTPQRRSLHAPLASALAVCHIIAVWHEGGHVLFGKMGRLIFTQIFWGRETHDRLRCHRCCRCSSCRRICRRRRGRRQCHCRHCHGSWRPPLPESRRRCLLPSAPPLPPAPAPALPWTSSPAHSFGHGFGHNFATILVQKRPHAPPPNGVKIEMGNGVGIFCSVKCCVSF